MKLPYILKKLDNIQLFCCNLDCPKLSQVTEDDIETFYSHKSKPVMLAAKEAHKKMIRKQNSAWFRLLNDESDSDDGLPFDDGAEDSDRIDGDDLANDIRNLNFEINTDHYYRELRSLGKPTRRYYEPEKMGITKKERNQLKTGYLKKAMTQMMKLRPAEARIWKDDLFDDQNVKHTLALLESQSNIQPSS